MADPCTAERVACHACDGTGDSGEFIENYAPATWTDPGWYEVQELPCHVCHGTGSIPTPTLPMLPRAGALTAVPLDDDLPF
mgnify:FL=1